MGLPEVGAMGGLILGTVVIIYAVLLFLLPFYVRRIQNEMIALNRTQKRVLDLLEALVPAIKKA